MSDDLERRLEGAYRHLKPSIQGVSDRFKPRASLAPLAWIAAAAAVIAVAALVWPKDKAAAPPPHVVKQPAPPAPETKTPAPEPPKTVEPPPVRPEPPASPPPPPAPEPEPPAPPKTAEPPPPPPTQPKERAVVRIERVEGACEIAGRRVKQGPVEVGAGDTIRAEAATKLAFSAERFLVLNAKSAAAFDVAGQALVVRLTEGELFAETYGAGQELRLLAGECEIAPSECALSVRLDGARVAVQVDEGRADVGKTALRAGQQAVFPGGAVSKADPKWLAWARKQRAAERVLLVDDFSKAGAWHADLENGLARSRRDGRHCASRIHLEDDRNGLFAAPVDGSITFVYRAQKVTDLDVVLVCAEKDYRRTLKVTRINAWQTVSLKLSELGDLPPGETVTKIKFLYGDTDETVTFWLDSIRIVSTR